MARPRASAAEWAKRVRGWRASGDSAAVYAEQRGWNAGTLTWWASRVGRAKTRAEPAVAFVRVVERREDAVATPEERPQAGAIEVQLGRGRTIRVVQGVDVELLRAVVDALEAR